MAVSDDVFARLTKDAPITVGSPPPLPTAPDSKIDQSAGAAMSENVANFFQNQLEHAKRGAANQAELVNAGARLFMASVNPMAYLTQDFPDAIQPGAATKASKIDAARLAREGPISKNVGAMTEGVVGVAALPAPGLSAGKNLLLGAGAGEGSEIGKFVFGGLGAMFGNRALGEDLGAVVGGAAGGYANNVRYNAMGKAIATPFTAAADAGRALRSTIKQQTGPTPDQRGAFSVFMDHYSDLRSASKGLLQEATNQRLAAVLQMDPEHQQAVAAFDAAAKDSGVNASSFTLSQKTGNETLVGLERSNQGRNVEEVAQTVARKKAQQQSIVTAYKAIEGNALPITPKSIQESAELYRAGAVAQKDALEKQADLVRKAMPNWTSTQSAESGAKMRGLYDEAKASAKQEVNQSYQQAYDMAGAQKYSLAPMRKDVKEVLDPLLSRIDPATTPRSIVSLGKLIGREGKEAAMAKSAEDNLPFYMKKNLSAPQAKGYSLQELHEVYSQLGSDANDARRAENFPLMRNLNIVADALEKQIYAQSTPETQQAFRAAQDNYRTRYVPRFKEGVNLNLDREATRTRAGREQITDQKVWDQYLDKGDLVDRMQQFDNLAGGKLGKSMPDAYRGLGEALQDRYSKEVIQGGFTLDKHDKFMRAYDAALERLPNTQKRIAQVADGLDKVNNDTALILDHYQQAMGGDITQAVSSAHAQKLFISAMSDPIAMDKVLKSNLGNTPDKAKSFLREAMVYADPLLEGQYDPGKLNTLLTMGQKFPGQPSTFETLAKAALGPKEGALHTLRLKAVAELMEREQLTSASTNLGQTSKGPIEQSLGQSGASIISTINAAKQGRTSGTWAGVKGISSYMNNQMQMALVKAQREALYDPEMSKAILELAKTPGNSPVREATWRKIGLTAKMIRELADAGLVQTQVARGALYGWQQNETDQERPSKKPKREMNLPR